MTTTLDQQALIPDTSTQGMVARRDCEMQTHEEAKKAFRERLISLQKGRGLRLKTWLQFQRERYRGLDPLPRRKRVEDIDLMHRYFNCDQYGEYSEQGAYEDTRQDGDYAYCVPILRAHVEQAALQLFKTNPKYEVQPDDVNDPNLREVSRMAETRGLKDLNRLLEQVKHDRIYNLLLGGEAYAYLYWGSNPRSPHKVQRMTYPNKKVVQVPGYRECQACNQRVVEDAESCSRCSSTYLKSVEGGQTINLGEPVATQVVLGENRIHVPHPMSIQRDMSALTAEDSTFLIERSYLDKHAATWKYQRIIEDYGMGLSVEMQMRFDLERSSLQTDAQVGSARSGVAGAGRSMFGGEISSVPDTKVEIEREFLEASEYGAFYLDQDERLPNGRVLKAGTFFGDNLPAGAKIEWCGDTLIDVDDCVRGAKWSLSQYGRIAGTNAGAGMKFLMPLQDAKNDNFNLGHAVKHSRGYPLTVVDGKAVYELPGPDQFLSISKAGVDDVSKLVAQYPGLGVSQADGADEMIDQATQFLAGTNTVGAYGAGVADMKAAGTATGITAMQEQAAGRQMGPVERIILQDKELLYQILENIQVNCTEDKAPEQYRDLVKQYGEDVVTAFFKTNLRRSLTITVAANTDIPKSMALTQANQMAFAQIAAELLPMVGQVPWVGELLSSLADEMGIPLSIGEGHSDRREAEYRLNKLMAIEQDLDARVPALFKMDPMGASKLMYQGLAKICAPLITEPQPPQPSAVPTPGADVQVGDPAQTQDAYARTTPPQPQVAQPALPHTDPMVIAPQIFLQDHDAFMDVYHDAIFSDRAKAWSQPYKLVVIRMWFDHFKAKLAHDYEQTQMMAEVMSTLDPNAAAEAAKSQLQKFAEALQVKYADLPPDKQNEVLQSLGFSASADLQAESAKLATGEGEGGKQEPTADEVAGGDAERAGLDMAKTEHAAIIDDAGKEADHQRKLEGDQIAREHAAVLDDARAEADHQRQSERDEAARQAEPEEES